jgi:hypothetical protein
MHVLNRANPNEGGASAIHRSTTGSDRSSPIFPPTANEVHPKKYATELCLFMPFFLTAYEPQHGAWQASSAHLQGALGWGHVCFDSRGTMKHSWNHPDKAIKTIVLSLVAYCEPVGPNRKRGFLLVCVSS